MRSEPAGSFGLRVPTAAVLAAPIRSLGQYLGVGDERLVDVFATEVG